jgi:hypothetical protein
MPDREPTEAFDVGNALDALLLDGRKAYRQRVAVVKPGWPEKPTAAQVNSANPTADAKKRIRFWTRFYERSTGKILLSHENARLVEIMRSFALANANFKALVRGGESQVTFRSAFKHFTIQARPDIWSAQGTILPATKAPTGPYILDLKSAEDLDRFHKMLPKYTRQAALYCEVAHLVLAELAGCGLDEIAAPNHYFGVVLKSDPIAAAVYQLDPDDWAEATEEVRKDLRLLKRCHASNDWPALPKGVTTLPRVYGRKRRGD